MLVQKNMLKATEYMCFLEANGNLCVIYSDSSDNGRDIFLREASNIAASSQESSERGNEPQEIGNDLPITVPFRQTSDAIETIPLYMGVVHVTKEAEDRIDI